MRPPDAMPDDFFDDCYLTPKGVRGDEMRKPEYPDGFWHWLSDNEHIYTEFVRRALKVKQSRPHYAASKIVDEIRWDTQLQQANKEYKLDENMKPGLAMLAMAEQPELKGFFRTKARKK